MVLYLVRKMKNDLVIAVHELLRLDLFRLELLELVREVHIYAHFKHGVRAHDRADGLSFDALARAY